MSGQYSSGGDWQESRQPGQYNRNRNNNDQQQFRNSRNGQNSGNYSQQQGEYNSSNWQGNRRKEGSYNRNSSEERRRKTNPRDSNLRQVEDQRKLFKPHPRDNSYKGNTKTSIKKFSRVQFPSTVETSVIEELQRCLKYKRTPTRVTVSHIINKSIEFWDHFPSDTARLHVLEKNGVPTSKLEEFSNSVYPIIHHSTLGLIVDFLDLKRRHGTQVEKELYDGMDLLEFVDRLLKQRPLAFLGANDRYMLRGMKTGSGGFDAIGTDREAPPLLLKEYLSYDEQRISALVSLSSWSVFVNDGNRKNYGKQFTEGTYQPEGVIVGQVGARLKRPKVMEYIDCVVLRSDNISVNGYGDKNERHVNSVWGKMWGSSLPTYDEALATHNAQRDAIVSSTGSQFEYMAIGEDLLFNVSVYKKRIIITAEILLSEASARAEEAGKKAYVHVVGLGLGVWKAFDEQDQLLIEAWGDALCNVTNTRHIAHIDFSYIDCYEIHGVGNKQKFHGTDITIHFSRRNLHDLVPDDCILVCNYAWDGNSLPGNEFWLGKMCSTGDSAAACSTCIAEIHNHLLNPVVGSDTLRVTTPDGRAVHWTQYLQEQTSAGAGTAISASAVNNQVPAVQKYVPPVQECVPPVQECVPPVQECVPPVQEYVPPVQECVPPVQEYVPPVQEYAPVVQAHAPAGSAHASIVQDSSPAPAAAVTSSWAYKSLNAQRTTQQQEPPVHERASNPQPSGSMLPQESNETIVVAAPEEPQTPAVETKVEPEQIRHPTIPGLMIDNPLFKKASKKTNKQNKVGGKKSVNEGGQQSPNAKKPKNKGNSGNTKGKAEAKHEAGKNKGGKNKK